jgi:uncharacterized protein (TIGR03067 family)
MDRFAGHRETINQEAIAARAAAHYAGLVHHPESPSRDVPMTRILCLALTLACVASAADEKSPLTGTWTVVTAEEDGKPQADTLKAKFTFKGANTLLIKLADEAKPRELTCKLDDAKKPKHINLTYTDRDVTETATGIYELDGDKLKLCVAEPEVKERPTEFKSKSRKVTYMELTRDKP